MAGTVQNLELAELAVQEMEYLETLRKKHLSGISGTAGTTAHKCEKCLDSGYYEVERDGYVLAHECECGLIQRGRMESRLRFAAIPEEFQGQTVSNFRTSCYSEGRSRQLAEMAKHLATQYVKQFSKIRESGKGLYFYSGVKGSGKTRLAVSIANDLVAGQEVAVKFATTLQILDQIKKTWGEARGGGRTGQVSEQTLVDDIISVPVLVIDDIGVEQQRDWVNERFYNIINGRMIEKRITIFTSNYSLGELQLDDRIVNRIEKMTLPIEFPAESIRSMIARKENSDLLERLLGA